jgi:hypothetical protein
MAWSVAVVASVFLLRTAPASLLRIPAAFARQSCIIHDKSDTTTQGEKWAYAEVHVETFQKWEKGSEVDTSKMEGYAMPMHLRLILFACFALIAGCTTTDYLGRTYPPTQHVDVFFSPQDVKRPYEVMGEIRAEGDDVVSFESMQQKLVQEAMQKGADAMLIEKLDMTETGYTTVENKSGEKRKRRESSSTNISTTNIEKDRLISAKLLKYR